ncbi:MAG: sialidase family protein [Planctomycetia bacterium]|nr:sialidase family protein [Planctomycetia bacterium]
MKFNFALCALLFCIMAINSQWTNAEQGIGDDADPLAIPKVWKANEIPEDYSDAKRKYQGIPSIEATGEGRLWVTWYAGGRGEDEYNYVLLITSDDKGKTWSKPLFAVDPQDTTRAFDPSLWRDPQGRLWIFWAQANVAQRDADGKVVPHPRDRFIRDCRAGVWCMTCEHPEAGVDSVWSEPRRIADGIMLNKPIVDSRGQWLYPISNWRYVSRYPVPDELMHGPTIYKSEDEGKTVKLFGFSKLEQSKSRFDEHNIVELSDGTLWMTVRTLAGFGEAYSKDGGKTWSDTVPSPVIKNTSSRFFMQRLQSGHILLIKNGPVGQDIGRKVITASLSQDDGKTWTEPLVLDEREDVTYPGAAQAADGTIYVVWDRGRIKEKEILMARFTEDDLIQSKFASPDSETKVLINQAFGIR